MDIRYMEDFIELVQCASFTDAARRIGITQSALSKRLKAMEAELGTELLDRSGHATHPTLAGQALYAASVDIVNRYRGLGNELRRIAARPPVKVGGVLHDPFVTQMLDSLERPEAPYSIVRRAQAFDLLSAPLDTGELDVLFAPLDSDERLRIPNCTAMLLKSDDAVAAVRSDDALAARGGVALGELSGHVLLRIIDNHASDDGWHAIESMCLRSGFTPKAKPIAPDGISVGVNEAFLSPANTSGEPLRACVNADDIAALRIDDATFDLYMVASKAPASAAVAAFLSDAEAYASSAR